MSTTKKELMNVISALILTIILALISKYMCNEIPRFLELMIVYFVVYGNNSRNYNK